MQFTASQSVIWRMHTNATVSLDGTSATLGLDGQTMKRFDSESTPPGTHQDDPARVSRYS
ncbi:hypothetical protein FB451DRAFT_1398559 [Mycena latifolia]|nr:hypothetical protein FB451DRAFT_1398559 [Mycena latifolia]